MITMHSRIPKTSEHDKSKLEGKWKILYLSSPHHPLLVTIPAIGIGSTNAHCNPASEVFKYQHIINSNGLVSAIHCHTTEATLWYNSMVNSNRKSHDFEILEKICHILLMSSLVSTNKPISWKSKLLRLNPVLDEDGILRLNGRLKNAFMTFHERFPCLQPKTDSLCKLLIIQAIPVHCMVAFKQH